jgi:hypothetical protein
MTRKSIYAGRIMDWVYELRTGFYKQSRGRYHGSRGGHCCLGVGQIVCALPLKETHVALKKYLGLEAKDIDKLIALNDGGHRSFTYIANYIEKKILPRFLTKTA